MQATQTTPQTVYRSDTPIPTMTRLPPAVHRQVNQMAKVGDRSLSRQLVRLIELGLKHSQDKVK